MPVRFHWRTDSRYNDTAPDAELIGYLNGYRGLLIGESITFPSTVREQYSTLYDFGGSPIGNSRVKLTNVEDCIKEVTFKMVRTR